jgi:hypothetical protein
MYVYTCIYIYIYKYDCTFTHIYVHTHINMYIYIIYIGDNEEDIEISKIKDLKIKNGNLSSASVIASESAEKSEILEYLDCSETPRRKKSRHDLFDLTAGCSNLI